MATIACTRAIALTLALTLMLPCGTACVGTNRQASECGEESSAAIEDALDAAAAGASSGCEAKSSERSVRSVRSASSLRLDGAGVVGDDAGDHAGDDGALPIDSPPVAQI